MSIRRFYDRWPQYNRRLTEIVGAMTDEQLAIGSAPDRMSIWATVAHCAGVRVHWLCGVLGEPGADTTPWPDPDGDGWEDDPDHPRTASELVMGLDTLGRSSAAASIAGRPTCWTSISSATSAAASRSTRGPRSSSAS